MSGGSLFRGFNVSAAVLALCLLLCVPAQGASLLSGPAVMFVPTAEGAPLAAFFEQQRVSLEKKGMTVRLEFLPGRGGAYVWAKADSLPADGSAVLGLVMPDYILQAYLKEPFHKPGDARPVAALARAPLALWVSKNSGYESVEDFVAKTREMENPAVVVSDGSLTGGHLASLLFNRAAGVNSFYLPLMTEVECMEAVGTGRAAAWWGRAVPAAGAAANLKPLAVAAESRSLLWPEVPTFKELEMDVVVYSCVYLALPNGAEAATQKRVHDLAAEMSADAAWREAMRGLGWEAVELSPDRLPAFFEEESARIKALGLEYGLYGTAELLSRP